jgi:lysophospholipase L1-like esterase
VRLARLAALAIAGALGLALLALALYAQTLLPHPAAPGPRPAFITFIGDSLTEGSELPPGAKAYPELVAAQLGVLHHNLGIRGLTTREALVQELHLVPPETSTAVIYLGTNDLWRQLVKRRGPGDQRVPRLAFSIMDWALRRNGVTVYAVLLRDMSLMPRFAANPSVVEPMHDWIDSWDRWLLEQPVIPIDLRCVPGINDPQEYIADQVHPNVAGNRRLAKAVLDGIRRHGLRCAAPGAKSFASKNAVSRRTMSGLSGGPVSGRSTTYQNPTETAIAAQMLSGNGTPCRSCSHARTGPWIR